MTVKAALNAGEYFHGIKLKFASAIYFQKKCIYSFLVHRYRVGGVYKGCSSRRVSRVEIVTSQNAPLHRDCIRRSHLPEDRRVVRRKRSDGRVGATHLFPIVMITTSISFSSSTFLSLRGRAVVRDVNAMRERYCFNKTPAGPSPTICPAAMSAHAKSRKLQCDVPQRKTLTDDGRLTHTRNLFLGRSAFRYGAGGNITLMCEHVALQAGRRFIRVRLRARRQRIHRRTVVKLSPEIPPDATDSVKGVPRKRELWPQLAGKCRGRWSAQKPRRVTTPRAVGREAASYFARARHFLIYTCCTCTCTCPIEGNAWRRHLRQNVLLMMSVPHRVV
ncbi:hypothetical protein QTP88_012443 [Uroleucon formosanum]